jgi:hypothetical protein
MPATAVTLGDMVRITFLGWPPAHPKHGTAHPLILTWNNRPYTLSIGKDAFIPFDMAKVYFGDPRSVEGVIRIKDEQGNDMVVGDRAAEVIRLQQYWQNSGMATNQAKFREYTPGDRSFLDEYNGKVSDIIPDVQVFSLSGERIYMVTDDPYGDHVVVSQQTRAQEELMRTQLIEQSDAITLLKKQNAMLLAKLGLDPRLLDEPEAQAAATQDSAMEAPTDAVVSESPKMVYNPRTRRVMPRRPLPNTDPTTIDELPVDLD